MWGKIRTRRIKGVVVDVYYNSRTREWRLYVGGVRVGTYHSHRRLRRAFAGLTFVPRPIAVPKEAR